MSRDELYERSKETTQKLLHALAKRDRLWRAAESKNKALTAQLSNLKKKLAKAEENLNMLFDGTYMNSTYSVSDILNVSYVFNC